MESDGSDWQAILHGNHQVVLYNPTSRALAVTRSQNTDAAQIGWEDYSPDDVVVEDLCPYCRRPMAEVQEQPSSPYPRVPNYFHLLAESTSSSRPRTPPGQDSSSRPFGADSMADGYFATFFREERKLGMGANGSVFLCQHVLDGNTLGHFAVKKIAVGSSHEYLLKILHEVRLLETLRHPNIITYHHSWLETCRFSAFGPSVPTLFVLMQWAEGGSLDDFIASRQGVSASADNVSNRSTLDINDEANMTKAQRIAAFRARNRNEAWKGVSTLKAVHLLSADEILNLFGDVTAGLAFLHDRAILHLDLKPGNVLLTWDAGSLVPRAMLSDFGASKDMLQQNANTRTGITGTLEYTAPEVLRPDPVTGIFREMNTKSDMWSLGIILHKLVFFNTPYPDSEDFAALQEEIVGYEGFFAGSDVLDVCTRRGLPPGLLHLLQTLLDVNPSKRPTSTLVLSYVRGEKAKLVASSPPQQYRVHRRHQPQSCATNSLVRSPDQVIQIKSPAPLYTPPAQNDGELSDPPQSVTYDHAANEREADTPASRHRAASDATTTGVTSSLTIYPEGKPELVLPIPESTARSLLPPALRAVTSRAMTEGAIRILQRILLMVKIITLTQVTHPIPSSALRSALICLASALATMDAWNFLPSTSQTSTTPSRAVVVSMVLFISHFVVLSCLQYT